MDYYRVQANVDLAAICHNINCVKQIIKSDTKIMVVVKADAYGHGAIKVAKALENMVDSFGVAIIEEAIELREAGIKNPILVLGFTAKEQIELVIKNNITQTVFSYESANEINKIAKKFNKIAKVHIKIDTGMSRIGFFADTKSINEIKKINALENIYIEGIFSHFSGADLLDKSSANQQFDEFNEFISALEQNGVPIPIKHISNSAAVIDIPKANFNMVRCGIITYGLYPSEEVDKNAIHIIPAMEIKSHIIYIKEIPSGVGVSYGSTFVANRTTRIATIPVGYADGYSWALSNKGRVIIHGQYAPVLGRICMDQFMVDITDIDDVKIGDIVTLLGKDKDAMVSVEELSDLSYSFPYEFVCHVGKRIPRIYTK